MQPTAASARSISPKEKRDKNYCYYYWIIIWWLIYCIAQGLMCVASTALVLFFFLLGKRPCCKDVSRLHHSTTSSSSSSLLLLLLFPFLSISNSFSPSFLFLSTCCFPSNKCIHTHTHQHRYVTWFSLFAFQFFYMLPLLLPLPLLLYSSSFRSCRLWCRPRGPPSVCCLCVLHRFSLSPITLVHWSFLLVPPWLVLSSRNGSRWISPILLSSYLSLSPFMLALLYVQTSIFFSVRLWLRFYRHDRLYEHLFRNDGRNKK